MIDDFITFLFAFANLAITAGYLYLALMVMPKVTLTMRMTKIGGIGFFLLCGLTHLEMAGHAMLGPDETFGEMARSLHMLVIHLPQSIAVWMFVTGLYIELVRWGPWSRKGKRPVVTSVPTDADTSSGSSTDPGGTPR